MNEEDHPQGLPPLMRMEFNLLCEKLLELYHIMLTDEDKPDKLFGAGDDHGNCIMFFRGDQEKALKVAEFVKSLN